jgi:hypothetical protein
MRREEKKKKGLKGKKKGGTLDDRRSFKKRGAAVKSSPRPGDNETTREKHRRLRLESTIVPLLYEDGLFKERRDGRRDERGENNL